MMEVIQRAVAKRVQFRLTYRIFTSSMKFKWVSEQGVGIYDEEGNVIGLEGFVIDITRQKMLDDQVKTSQNRMNLLFSTMNAGCTIFQEAESDNRYVLLDMNEAAEKIEGRKKEDMKGLSFEELYYPDSAEELKTAFHQVVTDGKPRTLTRVPFTTPTGRRWREMYLTRSPHGHSREIFMMYSDVTDKIHDEEQIIASLQEKELLLKEVHHRVKNNLQIISGILKLQGMRTTDPVTNEILRDCRNQVFSMANIHEMLYNSKDISKIRIMDYVENLIDHLKQEYQGTGSLIHFSTDIDPDIILDIDRCIPCGLILNELITNAVKYAFEPGGEGEIRVSFRHQEPMYIMEVADNGRGIPDEPLSSKPTSLGTELVNRLVHQIRGFITVSGENGTKITIRFHDNPAVKGAL
jgi:PAS domain S-box-containing protein